MAHSTTLACEACGKPNSVRRGRKFCSLECAGTVRTRPASLSCAECGEEFTPKRAGLSFCSHECAAKSRRNRASLTCAECGTPFEVPQSAAGRRFCSRECADAKGWQHGTLYGYDRVGCRCGACAERKRTKSQAGRERAAALAAQGEGDIPHGTLSGYSYWSCRCDECRAARREAGVDEYARHADRERERSRRYKAAHNSATQGRAVNSRKEWTGPELELVVTRTDLTLTELAAMLGRSYAAVQCARVRATSDPKWMKVAGVRDA